MTSKRQKARAALLEWKAKTTPEMFVEEHKGIIFATTDKSPKLEIATDSMSMISAFTERFLSLWIQEQPVKCRKTVSVKPNPYDVVSISSSSFIGVTNQLTDLFETTFHQEHFRSSQEEFNLRNYDEMLNNVNKTPLRLI